MKRLAVGYLIERFGLSVRKSCRLTGLWRSTRTYQRRTDLKEDALRARLKTLAGERSTWGCPKLHAVLKREGLVTNHKRTERIYKEEKLSLKLRKHKTKRVSELRAPLAPAESPNERWSMDFIHSRLYQGRRFKSLTIVDDCTRESPVIEVDTSIPGIRVVRVLDRLKEIRGLPKVIVIDNGPEFSGKVLDDWAWRNGVKLDFIDPGHPQQNAYIESFNATFRKDCLNKNWFYSLEEAEETIEKWRLDYNEFRPHDSLDDLTPSEFMKRIALTQNQQESNFQVVQQTG